MWLARPLDAICEILTRLLENFRGLNLDHSGLIRESRDEVVVDDRNAVVLYARLENEVGDGSSIGEGGGVGVDDSDASASATIDQVRIKDGYMVEGRKDGVIGIWSC